MVIKASSAKQIDALVADLGAASAVKRDAAMARLTVIGARAVERLVALAESRAAASARVAALRTLEAIADARTLEPAARLLDHAQEDVAVAAAAVLRAFVTGGHGALAVDRLTTTVLDRSRPEAVRLAALRALTVLDRRTVAPLRQSLAADPSAAIRTFAHDALGRDEASRGGRAGDEAARHAQVLAAAVRDRLPDDPGTLREAIAAAGPGAPLQDLLTLIERIRDREASEEGPALMNWRTARAAAHAALAERGSRIALYDLREALETAAAPLPVELLQALSLVGDASCLEAIAAAYARSTDDWWRRHLADAFRAIVAREKLTRRHKVMKRVEKKWKGILKSR